MAVIANGGSFSRSGFQTKGFHGTVESIENPTDLGRLGKPSPPRRPGIDPLHLPLSCRSLSSGTHFENSNGTGKTFHSFLNA